MTRRFVGGPMDGQTTEAMADMIEMAGHPGMAYHRAHNPPFPPDPDWWIRGLPEPQVEVIYEWHRRTWVPPVVRAIRDAINDVANRRGV